MIAKLPWILLALSLLFNFFFAGGFLQAEGQRTAVATDQGAADKVIDQLGLDGSQRKGYLELRQAGREQARQLRRAITEIREQFWADLAGREPDPEELAELQELEAQQRHEYRLMMGRRLRQFMGMLTVEQRRRIAELAHRRLHRTPAGRTWRERWDTDNDGKISDQERAAARRALWRRRQEFRRHRHRQMSGQDAGGALPPTRPGGERRREMMLRRFDADGDGKLSDEERAKAFEAIRSRSETHGPASRPD